MPDFVNAHIMNAKVLVPNQPFGSKYRGGKLLALLSQSNEIRIGSMNDTSETLYFGIQCRCMVLQNHNANMIN